MNYKVLDLLERIAKALESISNSLYEMNESGVEVYLMNNSKDKYSRSYLESLSDAELIALAKKKGVLHD